MTNETRDLWKGVFWTLMFVAAASIGWHVGLPEMWRAVFK